MKKRIPNRILWVLLYAVCVLPVMTLSVSAAGGDAPQLEKNGNLAIVYGVVALLSVLLTVGCVLWAKKNERKFLFLYTCVAIVNCGYFIASVSDTLSGAMMANRLSYLGAAYSILVMLFIIMEVCRIKKRKWLNIGLIVISTLAFMLAASGDWLGLYYKSVQIENINGMTVLTKVYGPLHILYRVYLLSYFGFMVACIIRAAACKKLVSVKYAVFLAAVVLGNIAVWAVGQFIDLDFEFLSVSYIATEVLLLLLYGLLQDYGILQPHGEMASVKMLKQLQERQVPAGELPPNMEEMFSGFAAKVATLSTAERRILNYYIDGYETAQIPDMAFISIHTVKKHNRSIYQKLEIASRDELMLYIEMFRCCGRLPQLMGEEFENEK